MLLNILIVAILILLIPLFKGYFEMIAHLLKFLIVNPLSWIANQIDAMPWYIKIPFLCIVPAFLVCAIGEMM